MTTDVYRPPTDFRDLINEEEKPKDTTKGGTGWRFWRKGNRSTSPSTRKTNKLQKSPSPNRSGINMLRRRASGTDLAGSEVDVDDPPGARRYANSFDGQSDQPKSSFWQRMRGHLSFGRRPQKPDQDAHTEYESDQSDEDDWEGKSIESEEQATDKRLFPRLAWSRPSKRISSKAGLGFLASLSYPTLTRVPKGWGQDIPSRPPIEPLPDDSDEPPKAQRSWFSKLSFDGGLRKRLGKKSESSDDYIRDSTEGDPPKSTRWTSLVPSKLLSTPSRFLSRKLKSIGASFMTCGRRPPRSHRSETYQSSVDPDGDLLKEEIQKIVKESGIGQQTQESDIDVRKTSRSGKSRFLEHGTLRSRPSSGPPASRYLGRGTMRSRAPTAKAHRAPHVPWSTDGASTAGPHFASAAASAALGLPKAPVATTSSNATLLGPESTSTSPGPYNRQPRTTLRNQDMRPMQAGTMRGFKGRKGPGDYHWQ